MSFVLLAIVIPVCSAALLVAGVAEGYAEAYAFILADAVFLGYYVYLRHRTPAFSLLPLLGERPVPLALGSLLLALAAYLLIVAGVGVTHGAPHIDPGFRWTRITALVFIILAAAFEEVVARSYLFVLLRKRFGVGTTVLLTALVFTMLHYPYVFTNPLEFVAKSAFSLCMSALVIRFNSLLPAIIAHSVFNYFVGLKRLGLAAPLDHPGVVVYENLGVSNVYLGFEIAVCSLIALLLWLSVSFAQRKHSSFLAGRSRA